MSGSQAELRQDPVLADILQQAGMEGCLIVMEVHRERTGVSNELRCQERSVPASTFKIVNALIAFETGVVRGDERFPWNKTRYPLEAWEKDLTLQEAMAVSSVPVFQEVARRIGQQRMADWVTRLRYGNAQTGDQVDRFWLEGPLSISPLEQVRFMARLARGQLPVAERSLMALRRLMPQEEVEQGHLFGKTGWATAAKPMIGWYVGWVEEKGGPLVTFAVNVTMNSLEQAPLRKSLAMAALRHVWMLDH
ncbi:MAG: class D beta-lactamase [Magnetococcales bacterium]|nr:class D beta-lactamase [Magnetococcales bacterium]MBF0150235.1 class D beta-lactamase [Magnetococcales bacterium]